MAKMGNKAAGSEDLQIAGETDLSNIFGRFKTEELAKRLKDEAREEGY